MNKNDYLNKVNEILSDQEFYHEIKKDNTKIIARKFIEILKEYKKLKYLNFNEANYLYPSNYTIPSLYALIKIHKTNNPARLICPYQEHPLSNLSKFLSKIINPCIRNSRYSLKDSRQFINKIKNVELTRNDRMFSLDIINLFTNVPIEESLKIIENKIKLDDKFAERTNLPIDAVINLIKFCMTNTTFAFNGKFYSQKSGAPMGCNLSPVVSEAIVSFIFEKAIETSPIKPKFAGFYVDDSFLIVNQRYRTQIYSNI